ncbi:hypothetical protein EJ04DRAFT_285958 [Polyplosphaeria fusca]|uniref:Uncharacterized protein n=1 Tax=Polyplosphaeria fusca TaxID=682080 RepID=A0A9P4RA13_9PLEO|nr:hypothetical protein EJ04DRAFT_285958 [Polyplosphaeria fusca]
MSGRLGFMEKRGGTAGDKRRKTTDDQSPLQTPVNGPDCRQHVKVEGRAGGDGLFTGLAPPPAALASVCPYSAEDSAVFRRVRWMTQTATTAHDATSGRPFLPKVRGSCTKTALTATTAVRCLIASIRSEMASHGKLCQLKNSPSLFCQGDYKPSLNTCTLPRARAKPSYALRPIGQPSSGTLLSAVAVLRVSGNRTIVGFGGCPQDAFRCRLHLFKRKAHH